MINLGVSIKLPAVWRWTLSFLLFSLLMVGTVRLALFKVMDRDFWWHVKAGEIMVSTQNLIQTEPFSYARVGKPYLATYEWLAQVVLYLVHHTGGIQGVILFRIFMVFLCVLGLLALSPRSVWWASLVAFTAVLAAQPGFMDRPQLFTFAILCWFFFFLTRYLDQRSALASLIVLQIFWTNFHGAACVVGLMMWGWLCIDQMVGLLLDAKRSGRIWPHIIQKSEFKWLVGGTVGLMMAMLISPNFLSSFKYLNQLLTDKTIAFIGEWQPTERAIYLKRMGPVALAGLCGVLVSRRNKIFLSGVYLTLGFMSLQAVRHEMLFAFGSAGVAVYGLGNSFLADRAERFLAIRPLLTAGSAGLLFLLLLFQARVQYANFCRRDSLQGWGVFDLARGAYDFVEREKISGHMFNTYGIGGYLLFRGHPRRQVFIDGRNVDYGFDYMMAAYKAGYDPQRWDEIEGRYQFTYAIMDYDVIKEKQGIPYVGHLSQNPNWVLVYLDDWCVVYLKDTLENRPVIEKRAFHVISPFYLESGIVPKGFDRKGPEIESELRRALREAPDSMKLHNALSSVLLSKGNKEEALYWAEKSVRLRPHRPESHSTLAAAYLSLERWREAALAYDTMVKKAGPDYPSIRYDIIAGVFSKAGLAKEARYYHRKAVLADQWGNLSSLDSPVGGSIPLPHQGPRRSGDPTESSMSPVESTSPRFPMDAVPVEVLSGDEAKKFLDTQRLQPNSKQDKAHEKKLLGDLMSELPKLSREHNQKGIALAEAGKMEEAKTSFLEALKINPSYPEANNNLGSAYLQEGNVEKALEFYERALKSNPDYADAHYNKALCLLRKNELDRALNHAQKAQELGRNSADLLSAIAAAKGHRP
ncbi:MAG: Beta-barrel assembly-enhancing protease [Elusimicrobia bacterium]|nr:Beta-barrel assembly-enhancing protease [Elusimicrobiota bacterium]